MPRKLLFPLLALIFAAALMLLEISGPVESAVEDEQGDQGASRPHAASPAGDSSQESSEESSGRTVLPSVEAPTVSEEVEAPELPAASRYLEGRVIDEERNGIAGAWVAASIEGEAVTSDEEGWFALPLRQPFDEYHRRTVFAWKEGFRFTDAYARPAQPLRITLRSAEDASFRVRSAEDRSPIVGAHAECIVLVNQNAGDGPLMLSHWLALPIELEPSDAEGKISIPAGDDFRVRAWAEGYQERIAYIRSYRREVRLPRKGEYRLQLLDTKGTPIGGAQVAFSHHTEAVISDEQGWVAVPEVSRDALYTFQVVKPPLHWIEYTDRKARSSPMGLAGSGVVIDHYPRKGQLHLDPSQSASEYELATTSGNSSFGWNFNPDPNRNSDRLVWEPLAEDGRFELKSGWQGSTTFLHVRRKDDHGMVLQRELEGGGPYEFELKPTYPVRLSVEAEPLSLLEDAQLQLSGGWRDRGRNAHALDAEFGVDLRLETGRYRVSIQLADTESTRYLGSFEMPPEPFEKVFRLGAVRNVSGRVSCAGEPVFPCSVYLRDPMNESYRTTWKTNDRGEWQAEAVPAGMLEVYVKPEEGRLVPSGTYVFRIPAGVDSADFEIPLATVAFGLGNLPAGLQSRVRISRRHLSEHRSGAGRTTISGGSSLRLPDLSFGPATMQVAPCELEINLRDDYRILERRRYELRRGGFVNVELDTLEAGLVRAELVGEPERYRGRIEVEAVALDAGLPPDALEPRSRSNRLPHRIGSAYALAPGAWRVRVHGPLTRGYGRNQVQLGSEGVWEQEIRIDPGRETRVKVSVAENGELLIESAELESE